MMRNKCFKFENTIIALSCLLFVLIGKESFFLVLFSMINSCLVASNINFHGQEKRWRVSTSLLLMRSCVIRKTLSRANLCVIPVWSKLLLLANENQKTVGPHWFKWWLVACSLPRFYLNQCCCIANSSPGKRLRWIYLLIIKTKWVFIQENTGALFVSAFMVRDHLDISHINLIYKVHIITHIYVYFFNIF